jgi:hypothetical protein
MKKTLLIAAAALAAGVISTQAQVYSQNIVGYVNTPFPSGFTPIVNPLNNVVNTTTNLASNVIPNIPDLSYVYYWNGSAYVTYIVFENAYYDLNQNPVATPTFAVGNGLFINASQAFTNSFVGNVLSVGGPTGTTVTNTVNVAQGYNFLNSQVPVGGGITTALQLNAPDLSYIYTWNGSGWNTTITFEGAFYDINQNPTTEPQIKVGSGFFINASSAFPWSFVYTNQ